MRHGSTESRIAASRENQKKAVAARVAKGRVIKLCKGCGKECSVTMAYIRKGWKYCSWECRVKNMVGIDAANAGGGSWMVGESNINYKSGTSHIDCVRDVAKISKWRRSVFQKDKYVCQNCGYDKGKIIQAHHVKPYAEFPEHRYDVENGVTLCKPCHLFIHSKENCENRFICR